jgi:hypothetical protein
MNRTSRIIHHVSLARRQRERAFSIAEFILAAFVISMTLVVTLSVSSVALRATDKNTTTDSLSGTSRLAMDESLLHLRGANQVVASQSVNGTTYTTSASQIVLAEPGYDPATTKFYLDNVTDYTVIRYDANTKTIIETIAPGTGSVRPSRQNYVLARNVSSCTFTYRVRDYFNSSSTGNIKFTLSASATATPTCYVNGTQTSYSFNSSNGTAQVQINTKNSDVQFVYTINPTSVSATMASVCEVAVVFQFATTDSRQITRSTTLQGAARLRNLRK